MNNIHTYQFISEFLGFHLDREENPVIKKERTTKPYLYLYHGTDHRNIDSIRKHGLDPKYLGTHWDGTPLDDITRITGIRKPVVFLASDKRYSDVYGDTILKCKVYSKFLFFSMAQKVLDGYADEYLYIVKIPPKDIIFNKEL
jgi:hypothetical protein